MPKTKKGMASPAGEAPAQEFAESAVQGSVGCFGFLARDDGSDEEDTIKAGVVSDDEPSSPVGGGLGSPRSSSQSVQAFSLQGGDSERRLKEADSIGPRESGPSPDRASSSLPGNPSGSTALQPSSSGLRTADSSGYTGSNHHRSNSRKAEAVTAVPPVQHKEILRHQLSKQDIKPPSPSRSSKFSRWKSAPFKESMRLFRSSMAGSTAVAA